ncbi:MAG: copper resistance protein B [Pseudomonadota bacterium]
MTFLRAACVVTLGCFAVVCAHAQESQKQSHAGMTMDHMNDDPVEYLVLLDRLEFQDTNAAAPFAWDARAWVGRDLNRLYLRSGGEIADGKTQEATVEAFWARPVSRWWNLALGVREDFRPGDSRGWLAAGVMGLTPYRFNVQATAYLGDAGRTALRVEVEYDMLLTNRLILQPRVELDAYGKDDPERDIRSGISSLEVGLRLRYEIRREFAPYAGVAWVNKCGYSNDVHELRALAGLRIWF